MPRLMHTESAKFAQLEDQHDFLEIQLSCFFETELSRGTNKPFQIYAISGSAT